MTGAIFSEQIKTVGSNELIWSINYFVDHAFQRQLPEFGKKFVVNGNFKVEIMSSTELKPKHSEGRQTCYSIDYIS